MILHTQCSYYMVLYLLFFFQACIQKIAPNSLIILSPLTILLFSWGLPFGYPKCFPLAGVCIFCSSFGPSCVIGETEWMWADREAVLMLGTLSYINVSAVKPQGIAADYPLSGHASNAASSCQELSAHPPFFFPFPTQ